MDLSDRQSTGAPNMDAHWNIIPWHPYPHLDKNNYSPVPSANNWHKRVQTKKRTISSNMWFTIHRCDAVLLILTSTTILLIFITWIITHHNATQHFENIGNILCHKSPNKIYLHSTYNTYEHKHTQLDVIMISSIL